MAPQSLSSSGLSRGSRVPHTLRSKWSKHLRTYWTKTYWVYILASQPRGTLYIGVTNDILGRIRKHRDGIGSKFTSRYNVRNLVYYEEFNEIRLAIQREKTLKDYVRDWKINLIERENPYWRDLYPELVRLRGLPGDNAS